MSEPNPTNFRIKICDSSEIRVEQTPKDKGQGDFPACSIQLTDLSKRTIKLFIEMLRQNRLKSEKEFQLLGEYLYSVLLDNPIGEAIIDQITTGEKGMLRVELEFEAGQQELASWPWEYLYRTARAGRTGGPYFLAGLAKLLLTRYLGMTSAHRLISLKTEDLPVRVLFVAASPTGEGFDPVQHASVLETINDLAERSVKSEAKRTQKPETECKGRIKVWSLDASPEDDISAGDRRATFFNFNSMLDFRPHVIHFVCHGECTEEHGQIAFLKKDGSAEWITDTRLANALVGLPDLRLVLLQACESARAADPYQAVSGVAKCLANQDIPAVVAMQYRVTQQVANLFSRTFYEMLADCKPVDVAVQKGRDAIRIGLDEKSPAFALPVLFLRDYDPLLPAEEVRMQAPPPAGTPLLSKAPSGDVIVDQAISENRSQDIPTPIKMGRQGESQPSRECPWCSKKQRESDKFCICGACLICPKCGTPVREQRPGCSECREPLPQPYLKPASADPVGPIRERLQKNTHDEGTPWRLGGSPGPEEEGK